MADNMRAAAEQMSAASTIEYAVVTHIRRLIRLMVTSRTHIHIVDIVHNDVSLVCSPTSSRIRVELMLIERRKDG